MHIKNIRAVELCKITDLYSVSVLYNNHQGSSLFEFDNYGHAYDVTIELAESLEVEFLNLTSETK